jgi:DNA-binding IclR family transcriptional regulator
VVNVSFPILNVQGQAIAGLTIPYVKRIEDNVGVDEVVSSMRQASRQISEAIGAPLDKL